MTEQQCRTEIWTAMRSRASAFTYDPDQTYHQVWDMVYNLRRDNPVSDCRQCIQLAVT